MTETIEPTNDTNALIKQWMPLAYKVAKQYTPTKFIGTAEANDIQAAALEGLVIAVRKFNPARGLPFYTVAKNTIRWTICLQRAGTNILMSPNARSRARRLGEELPVAVSADALTSFAERVQDGAPDGFDEAADAEQRRKLRHAIDQLPHRIADVMRMFYFDELSYPEIGKRMGVTRQRVYQILQQGTARVTALVQGQAAAEPTVEVVPLLRRPAAVAWSSVDENGISTHYLCNGTGKVRTGPKTMQTCTQCNGTGYRQLADPLACAV